MSKAIAIAEELAGSRVASVARNPPVPAAAAGPGSGRAGPEPCYLYDLACHLALASTLPGQTLRPDPAGRGVQALRDLVASGFDNRHKLRTDPRLSPLRQRADFRKLVLELRTQAGER